MIWEPFTLPPAKGDFVTFTFASDNVLGPDVTKAFGLLERNMNPRLLPTTIGWLHHQNAYFEAYIIYCELRRRQGWLIIDTSRQAYEHALEIDQFKADPATVAILKAEDYPFFVKKPYLFPTRALAKAKATPWITARRREITKVYSHFRRTTLEAEEAAPQMTTSLDLV